MSTVHLFPLQQDVSEFEDKALSLLPQSKPLMAWVDNRPDSEAFWHIALLYADGSVLTRSAVLVVGEYRLVIRKGAVITADGDGFSITDGYTFMTDLFSFSGDTLTISKDGTLRFSITITSPEDIGIGMEYASTALCPIFGDRVPSVIRSPLLDICAPMVFEVEFFPFYAEKTYFRLAQDYELSTVFTTVYGEPVRLKFPKNFRFVFEHRASRLGKRALYLTPDGIADGVKGGLFMPGLSGTEYIRLSEPYTITFHSGRRGSWDELASCCTPTAPRISISGETYHCQPQQSRYYRVPNNAQTESAFRQYQELPGIPVQGVELPVIPLLGILGDIETVTRLEQEHIYPERRTSVERTAFQLDTLGADNTEAATRHGLRVMFQAGHVNWLRLAITEEVKPQMAFTNVAPNFMVKLLANNLFLPLNDSEALDLLASTPFSFTNAHLNMAKNNGYTQTELLRKLCDKVYFSREEFEAAVRNAGALPNDILLCACDHFGVTADAWRFLCNPSRWDSFGTATTIKFTTTACLSELSRLPDMWSGKPNESKILAYQRLVAEMETSLEKTPNAELHEILYDANWCGTVVFSCAADADNLPDELKFLASGIDKSKFFARFIAFPADSGKERGNRVCAMIDYQDDVHLRPEEYKDYAFKVMRLRVCIRNGKVYDFGAKVELLVNELFGCAAFAHNKTGGNSIAFNGSYQKDGDNGHYIFALDKPEEYNVQNSLIENVSIESAALLTGERGCRFSFGGTLRLYTLGETDMLSYDRLPFGGMVIEMNAAKNGYDFDFGARQMYFEQDGEMREKSFARVFPVAPVKILLNTAAPPQQIGYTKLWVQNLEQGDIGNSWHGLLWEIRSGDLGNLSGIESTIEILTAWSPNAAREAAPIPVFVGIKLGAAGSPDDWGLPLQGVMTLGFDAIELRHKTEKAGETEKVSYYLRFRNFALKILGIRFPDTNNDLYLISDEQRRLGWYGAAGG